MRQLLRQGREQVRELTLEAKADGDRASIEASGAIRLTLHDFLPSPHNELDLPPGLDVELGVQGNEVWPASISDVEMEEEGETAALTSQQLGFSQVRGVNPKRTTLTVCVSNRAIDSAGFDLLGYVQRKFMLAQRIYLASHLYSSAQFAGNRGPFVLEDKPQSQSWSVMGDDIARSILAQMTAMEESGYDTSEACIVMDYTMETRLKYTPVVRGEGRMIIQDGRCMGYPYVANRFFNTEIGSDGQLVRRDSDALGIAIFKWFKVAQHDTATVRIDGASQEVAARNVTSVTISTEWSFTDLSAAVNGAGVQAFHTLISERGYLADVGDHIFETSDGLLLTVGISKYDVSLSDADDRLLITADDMTLDVKTVR